MLHTVNFVTRFQNNCGSATDNILINKSQLHMYNVLPLYNGLSDHDVQCLVLKKFFQKGKNSDGQIQSNTIHGRFIKVFSGVIIQGNLESDLSGA